MNESSIYRRHTRQVSCGGILIGGDAPVSVQSMTNTDTHDIEATCEQGIRLRQAGCEILRVAVPDKRSAAAIPEIRERVGLPIVADVHYDHRLAIAAVEHGADKLRINPGNIGASDKVQMLADCARAHGVPIRVGANSGSIERDLLQSMGPTAQAMVQSVLRHVRLLEDCGFYDIVIALKASDIRRTVDAYRAMAKLIDYPLHIGITEAGTPDIGTVKSAIGIGALLLEGLGDTVRVSLTGDPVQEVHAAKMILRSLGLRREGVEIISCPTCGRTRIDLINMVQRIEEATRDITVPLTVAVMGCVVNGPGEAREADIGLAGGEDSGVIFQGGERLEIVRGENMLPRFIEHIRALADSLHTV